MSWPNQKFSVFRPGIDSGAVAMMATAKPSTAAPDSQIPVMAGFLCHLDEGVQMAA